MKAYWLVLLMVIISMKVSGWDAFTRDSDGNIEYFSSLSTAFGQVGNDEELVLYPKEHLVTSPLVLNRKEGVIIKPLSPDYKDNTILRANTSGTWNNWRDVIILNHCEDITVQDLTFQAGESGAMYFVRTHYGNTIALDNCYLHGGYGKVGTAFGGNNTYQPRLLDCSVSGFTKPYYTAVQAGTNSDWMDVFNSNISYSDCGFSAIAGANEVWVDDCEFYSITDNAVEFSQSSSYWIDTVRYYEYVYDHYVDDSWFGTLSTGVFAEGKDGADVFLECYRNDFDQCSDQAYDEGANADIYYSGGYFYSCPE